MPAAAEPSAPPTSPGDPTTPHAPPWSRARSSLFEPDAPVPPSPWTPPAPPTPEPPPEPPPAPPSPPEPLPWGSGKHEPATHVPPPGQGTPSSVVRPLHAPILHVSLVEHGFLSSQPVPSASGWALHTPILHTPPWMQSPGAKPHRVSSATGTLEHWPVCGSQIPGSKQGAGSGHSTGLDPEQAPTWHESMSVQALPSSQGAPSSLSAYWHWPWLHTAAWSHWSSGQATGVPTHLFPAHASDVVQALLSSHAVPGGLLVPEQAPFEHVPLTQSFTPPPHSVPLPFELNEQVPVWGSHIPFSRHGSGGTHVTAEPLTHTPFEHVSTCEHAFPSLQLTPERGTGTQPWPWMHSEAWHCGTMTSLHVDVPMHMPPMHTPVGLQRSAGTHGVPSGHGLMPPVPP